MTAAAHLRGHPITWTGFGWVYVDTGEPTGQERPCARCGRIPTPEGYDACLGEVPGATAACCGHGVENPYTKRG